MKKILGISLVAVLAVSPMMAHATGELGEAVNIGSEVAVNTGDDGVFAAQSYVKGAYNAIMGDLDSVNDAVTTLNGNEDTVGSVKNAIKTAVTASAKSAGAGLTDNQGAFDVNVDGTTIEINNSDSLQVKAGSIGTTQLSDGVNTSLNLANSALQSTDIETTIAETVAAASDEKLLSEKAIKTAIEAAKTAATYDDTALSARVTANADAIAVNNRRLIPVATGWRTNSGADVTDNVQFSDLELATVQQGDN